MEEHHCVQQAVDHTAGTESHPGKPVLQEAFRISFLRLFIAPFRPGKTGIGCQNLPCFFPQHPKPFPRLRVPEIYDLGIHELGQMGMAASCILLQHFPGGAVEVIADHPILQDEAIRQLPGTIILRQDQQIQIRLLVDIPRGRGAIDANHSQRPGTCRLGLAEDSINYFPISDVHRGLLMLYARILAVASSSYWRV